MPIGLLPLGLVATRSRVRVRRIAAAVVFGLLLCVTARAIEQQARPVTVLVGFAPGGVPDLVARVIAEKLQERLERTFIVENRAGAGGQLALAALHHGRTDGSTYALSPPGMLTLYPTLYRQLPYDVSKLDPVVSVCTFDLVIVAGIGSASSTLSEHIAWVKAHPENAFYAVPALGGAPHLVGAILSHATGLKLEPTPYRGGPQLLQDLLNGSVPLAITVTSSHLAELHRQGRLRILATTGTRRNALLTEVPTVAELGYARATSEEWFAFFARAGTPATETLVFAQAVQDVVALPDVQASLQKHGLTPVAKLSAELRQDIAAGTVRWARIARDIGFRLDN